MFALFPPSSRVTGLSARAHRLRRPCRPRSSGEDDLADVVVRHEPLPDDGSRAGDDLEQTLRQTRLECELAEPHRGERSEFGGLEHDGVARGERRREPPGGDRHREVPRHDDPDDAVRLVERDVDAAGDRDLLPDESLRRSRVVIQHLRDVRGLPPRGRDGVSRVADLEQREFLHVRLDDPGESAHRIGAGERGERGPVALRPHRARDRRVDIVDARPRDLPERLGGRGVDDGESAHAICPVFMRAAAYAAAWSTSPANRRRSSTFSSGCHCTPTT